MNIYNDPRLYDRVFYPKKWPVVLSLIIFGAVSAGIFYFLWKKFLVSGSIDRIGLAIALGLGLFSLVGAIAFFSVQTKFRLV